MSRMSKGTRFVVTAGLTVIFASAGCRQSFYDLQQSEVVIEKKAPRQAVAGSMRISAEVGEWPLLIFFRVADYERLRLDTRRFQFSLADMTHVVIEEDNKFIRADGSLTQTLAGIETTIGGDLIAVGSASFEGADVAVAFASRGEERYCYLHDIRDDCPGVVWGDDDCNNNSACIDLSFDKETNIGKQKPGTCQFHDVTWNPWNFCHCDQ